MSEHTGLGPAAENREKTHCVRGHALSGENLVWRKTPLGGKTRACRKCLRAIGHMSKGKCRTAKIKKVVGPPLFGPI